LGGVVAYANEIKINQLGVPPEMIEEFGAVSAETAQAMAEGARKLTDAAVGVAITGIAGPAGETDEKPVGTIYIALSIGEKSFAKHFIMGADREINRERSVTAALNMIRKELLGIE
jgi:nicotinamide-nucleotide amidase